jgi:hypothetical protein
MVMVYPRRIDLQNTTRSLKRPRSKASRRHRRRERRREVCRNPAKSPQSERMLSSPAIRTAAIERMVASFGEAAQEWRIHDIGAKVAALMTMIIQRRRRDLCRRPRHIAGRCRADLAVLTDDLGSPLNAAEEIADLPAYLAQAARRRSPPRHADFRRDRRREDERHDISIKARELAGPAPTSSISVVCRTRLLITRGNDRGARGHG